MKASYANAAEYRPVKYHVMDVPILTFLLLLLLSTQGLTNFLLRGLGVDWWKQAALFGIFALAIYRSRLHHNHFLICGVTVILLFVACFASLLSGVSGFNIVFNVLLYCSWLPFFIIAAQTDLGRVDTYIRKSVVAVIVLSSVGIVVQLYTPYLNFLIDTIESVEYASSVGDAQRIAFVYVASTLVMPTLVSLFALACLAGLSPTWRLLSLPFLVAAAIPTGSLAGVIMLVDAFFLALSRTSLLTKTLGIACGAAVVAGVVAFASIDDTTSRQLERVFSNNAESESNQGRLEMWRDAMTLISSFRPEEHLFGKGLGVTNGNRSTATTPHGESSFFQAYIEGGILGLSLRLIPFALISFYSIKYSRYYLLIHIALLTIVCGTAPLFGAFGIQCTLGYAAGIIRRGR